MYASRNISVRRRRLPHWTAEEGTYFVTFRLVDAISEQLARTISACRRPRAVAERAFDRSEGQCWLWRPKIAEIVERALLFFDERRYSLHAWSIMPNHVHVAVRLAAGQRLDSTLHSWKSYTAAEANSALRRDGAFWQTESYDSLLHDQNDLNRVIAYILDNPTRAHVDVTWTRVLRPTYLPPGVAQASSLRPR